MTTPTLTKVVRVRDGHVEEYYVFPTGRKEAMEVWKRHQLRKDGQPYRRMLPIGRFVQPLDFYGTYEAARLYALYGFEREREADAIRAAIRTLTTALEEKQRELMTLYGAAEKRA